MKQILIISLVTLSASFLFSQSDTLAMDSCLHFEDYNFCYTADYRADDNKVGLICEIKDFMINPNVEIASYYVFISTGGELLPARNPSWNTIVNLLSRCFGRECLIGVTIKINLNGEIVDYPSIMLSNCK